MTLDWYSLLIIAVTLFATEGFPQEKPLRKSGIKHSIVEFGNRHQEPDTAYLRYTFDNSQVLYGVDPGWHGMAMPYSLKKDKLTLGFDQWTIEAITDSTLTIFLQGFRRMYFYAENYLVGKQAELIKVGEYNGKPLYKANQIITPRYKASHELRHDIMKQDRADDYNIRKAGTFLMSFIVTDDGKIYEPTIIRGVAPGYDSNVIKELLKTSGRWTPAMFNGQTVNTLMMFEIRFLDSFDQR